MQQTCVCSLDWDDPLEKGMATHSSILAWRIPWTEEPGRIHSRGSQRVEHSCGTNTHTHTHTHTVCKDWTVFPLYQPYTPRALLHLLSSPVGCFNEASLAFALCIFSLSQVTQAVTEHLDEVVLGTVKKRQKLYKGTVLSLPKLNFTISREKKKLFTWLLSRNCYMSCSFIPMWMIN